MLAVKRVHCIPSPASSLDGTADWVAEWLSLGKRLSLHSVSKNVSKTFHFSWRRSSSEKCGTLSSMTIGLCSATDANDTATAYKETTSLPLSPSNTGSPRRRAPLLLEQAYKTHHQHLQPPRCNGKGRGVFSVRRSGVEQRSFAHTASPLRAFPSLFGDVAQERHEHCRQRTDHLSW